ncbi:MAG: NAD(P)/FAD-dependent oxidoreductase [Myxococcota bacterium]
MSDLDAIVVGSGPNGLAAAVRLAQAGRSVLVLEAAEEIGGGTRSAALTRPGFLHDVCSAAHPLGVLSPYFQTLPLGEHGLRFLRPPASVAHPMDEGPAVMLWPSVEETAAGLGIDASAYQRFVAPWLRNPHGLLADILGPLRLPKHPFLLARFGLSALRSATGLARARFAGPRARALFAGCAAHAIQPLEHAATAALGLLFLMTGHVEPWPVVAGGSRAIAQALASLLQSLGGVIETGRRVDRLAALPPAKVVLFDTSPRELSRIAEDALPLTYRQRLGRYRYGPGVFKLDWALDGPVPWRDPACLSASTVHLGGTLEEIAAAERAMWRGEHPERPYLIFCQQSLFDETRAPKGQHTGYAYCHVPAGSDVDLTEVVEAQVERFAPGFRDRILARHARTALAIERYQPSYVGGAITGGIADLGQLFTRPVARWDPYSTPNPRLFLCSHATPPGGGVHGMCGYFAAESALRRLGLGGSRRDSA